VAEKVGQGEGFKARRCQEEREETDKDLRETVAEEKEYKKGPRTLLSSFPSFRPLVASRIPF
jgi:hypothetical protein